MGVRGFSVGASKTLVNILFKLWVWQRISYKTLEGTFLFTITYHIYNMASNDLASELEKGSQECSPVPDSGFKERKTESTDRGIIPREKAGGYSWCTC